MLLTMVRKSFSNQRRAMVVMLVSVAAGTAIAASLLALSFDISSKVSKELRSFGANITVQPRLTGLADMAGQQRYLREEDIVRAKTIFWRHNIVGIVPLLTAEDRVSGAALLGTWYRKDLRIPGEDKPFEAGVASVMPWWDIKGRWPAGDNELIAGASYARDRGLRLNDTVTVRGRSFTVTGILETGGNEDAMLVMDLGTLQSLAGLQGKISKVLVSALTTPMDAFAYKDPRAMTRKEYDKWYCTGYVTSIAKQLEEVFAASTARPVWPVAETEGRVLTRLNTLIWLLTAATLLASALGVSTTMVMSLLRRSEEVALMKAIGADSLEITTLFLSEALVIGIAGGCAGYFLSLEVSAFIGTKVFGALPGHTALLFPVSVGASVVIVLIGVYLPIRRALRVRPAEALRV